MIHSFEFAQHQKRNLATIPQSRWIEWLQQISFHHSYHNYIIVIIIIVTIIIIIIIIIIIFIIIIFIIIVIIIINFIIIISFVLIRKRFLQKQTIQLCNQLSEMQYQYETKDAFIHSFLGGLILPLPLCKTPLLFFISPFLKIDHPPGHQRHLRN